MSRDALVVGINSYHLAGLKPLRSAAADAEAIAQCMEEYGSFRVWRLPEFFNPLENHARQVARNQEVTTERLEKALVQLFKPSGTHIPDTALFFFSGHGLRKERGFTEGYLATSDANPDQGNWGVSLRWLRELLIESPVPEQIVWLDCCYSGEALNFRDADPGAHSQQQALFLVAAAREFEEAHVAVGRQHSVLTTALIQGLNPNHQSSGIVTNDSLIQSIEKQLRREIQEPIWISPSQEILLTGRRRADLTPTLDGVCPYRGLQPFYEEHAAYFYGREALTTQLLKRVQIGQGNFVAVVGASGSGKSSVVRAGLLHHLRQGFKQSGSDQWRIGQLTPKERPLESLAEAFLDEDASDIDRAEQLHTVETAIAAGAIGLARLIKAAKAPRTLLVIDQFEELFTLCQNPDERQRFLDCLLGALPQTHDKLCVVIAMRADFMGKCTEQSYSGLAALIQDHLILVEPMQDEDLRQVIRQPAQQVGLSVEDTLVEQILIDLSIEDEPSASGNGPFLHSWEPGSLPLLEYTLEQLWQHRVLDRLTLDRYIELGGVRQALETRANRVYQSFAPEEQQTAKRIFLALTHLGEGTEDTRRRIFKQDLITPQQPKAQVEAVIQKLAAERLIVTSQVSTKGPESGQGEVVDIAHEALIRYWNRLRQWVSSNRDAIRIARKLEAAAQEWQSHGKPEDIAYLLQGARLSEAELFLEEYGDRQLLSGVAQDFIAVSQRVTTRLKRAKQAWRMGGVVAVCSVVAIVAAGFAVQQQRARQTLEAVFLSNEPAQVARALPQFFAAAEDLEQTPTAADLDLALAYYREILAVTNHLLASDPSSFAAELQQGRDRAEAKLAELISDYRMADLEAHLAANELGYPIPGSEFTAFEERFTEGALRTTYRLLLRDFGAGADRNDDGQLSAEEAQLLPCDTLLAIQQQWQQAKPGCTWDGAGCIETPIDDTQVATLPLAIAVFDYVGVSYAMDRIESCPGL